jgi:hypothetical protein
MNLSRKLTIASLVLGGLGSLLFIIHKTSSKKTSLISNSGKGLIAIGLILLAIAVLLLSQNNEHFESYSITKITPPKNTDKQYFLVKISNLEKNTKYNMYANDGVFGIFKSNSNGEINFKNLVLPESLPGLPIPADQYIRIAPNQANTEIYSPRFTFNSTDLIFKDEDNNEFTLIGYLQGKETCKCLVFKYKAKAGRIHSFGIVDSSKNCDCPK